MLQDKIEKAQKLGQIEILYRINIFYFQFILKINWSCNKQPKCRFQIQKLQKTLESLKFFLSFDFRMTESFNSKMLESTLKSLNSFTSQVISHKNIGIL